MNKIAAIQMCSSNDVDENLTLAEGLINQAAQAGAQMIVLPEMFAMMGEHATNKVDVKESFSQGRIQNFLAKIAKELNIWLVAGTIPITASVANKVRAACLVYDNQGKVVARYDKMHLFDVALSEQETYCESATTEPGDNCVVVDTPLGKLGLAVCYDIRFPLLFNQLVQQGAEIIAIPAAFTVRTGLAHWELLARSRAVDTFCYIIGACQSGMHKSGRQTYGHSLIVEPWGTVVAHSTVVGNDIVYADVDLVKVREARRMIPL